MERSTLLQRLTAGFRPRRALEFGLVACLLGLAFAMSFGHIVELFGVR